MLMADPLKRYIRECLKIIHVVCFSNKRLPLWFMGLCLNSCKCHQKTVFSEEKSTFLLSFIDIYKLSPEETGIMRKCPFLWFNATEENRYVWTTLKRSKLIYFFFILNRLPLLVFTWKCDMKYCLQRNIKIKIKTIWNKTKRKT